jgi:threonine synthase
MRKSGGWAAAVSDAELVAGIRLLAESTGIFTETAGGVTVAAALALARQDRFTKDDEVVLCITGNGLKTTDAVRDVLRPVPVIEAKVRAVAALVAASSDVVTPALLSSALS